MNFLYLTLSILLPLVLNLIFTPIIIAVAHKKNLFDVTDHRKTHVGNIPRLGGIGIFLATVISAITMYILIKSSVSISFYIAISIIFISGIVDDVKPVRAYVKLLTQIAASLTLIVGGFTLSHIYIPFIGYNLDFGILKYPITFIWVIGVTNALNLLDGMDGQAGGVSVIASITIGIVALLLGQTNITVICFILAGSLIGFLNYNLPPAKIFMGDSGSLTIGFFLAAAPLLFQDTDVKGRVLLVGIAVLLIPIFDVFSAMIRRTKLKISFFHPDRGHIHHKFIDFTSLGTKQILLVIYSICILSGTLASLFIFNTNILTEIGLVLNLIIHLILFGFLHRRKKAGVIKR
ncbi:undecaprenyl/decaprenyl-phosphate alpha-N-acetylglucosaminyl 1-phosphate transferase [Thiospirochaeta perfilievii]|uniref:Undecaprenyl/decaprenyl-phosphate alpha-N-acetylglucosaminyl 1-phosphate transferase n=1 Tax=Thiospirochaeta perfilievii TaxID=252967 RepID=A0A5C1QE51_9SPIO|nr:MraY family glycosyltransferase [Thiospirochaeta perfilievii]QEN05667.1 undecaprenyl/decaprenyl-phosphate alpha-N-acetylglucosaminyl 1-phosphate transferase [Thiospirochaeta perfilievii]